jgi:hypothetical protein
MARMLGRYLEGGCVMGGIQPCCLRASDPRRAKRREQRAFRRSLLPEGEIPTLLEDPWDCIHGCNGDCLTYDSGDSPCGFTCHPQISNEDARNLLDRTAF